MIRLWRTLRPHLPQSAVDAVVKGRRAYVRLRCWGEGLRDRAVAGSFPIEQIPPAWLRFRIGGSTALEHFLAVGERTTRDIRAALAFVGADLDTFTDVLDFGCGCGRTLLWLADRSGGSSRRFRGVDVDAEAIAWCREHLPFARFDANPPLPPIDAPDGAFDLVYGISVFTHLDLDRQRLWLAELRRIVRPGGYVLLTLHGEACAADLPAEHRATLARDGFAFVRTDSTRGFFPDWYQAAYQTPAQVRRTFSAFFDVAAHIPRGVNDHQDVVVLRRG